MRQIKLVIANLVMLALDAALGQAAGMIERRFLLPDHGYFVAQVPPGWKDQVRQPPNRLPPTIVFHRSSGQPFEILLTTIWPAGKDRPRPPREVLRKQVENAAEIAKSQSAESKLQIKEFQGRSGDVFYFSATDRAPKAGEYKFLTQGILPVGELTVTFTILTNDGQEDIVKQAIELLKSAAHDASKTERTHSVSALTEKTAVNVPDQGWQISFDSPPLSNKQESKRGDDYAFKADSGRFNISLFVEQPRGTGNSHRDCYGFYWAQASRNPKIARDTVVTSDVEKFFRVQYDLAVEFRGQPIRQRHVNYYIAFRDKWIDVHVSIIAPTPEDQQIFTTFDKSLRYGT